MFCKRCNAINKDDADKCVRCGADLRVQREIKKNNVKYISEDKTTVGFILGILLGILGLAIGLIKYSYEEERRTFLTGWAYALVLSIVIWVIVLLLANCYTFSVLDFIFN